MAVTKEQVMSMAKLVRLDLKAGHSAEDAEQMVTRLQGQMDEIVAYMDSIGQVDTTGVEPLYSPVEEAAPPREDVVLMKQTPDAVLANAPERQQNFFVVPPVI